MGGLRKTSPCCVIEFLRLAIYFQVPKNHLGGSLTVQITVPNPKSSILGWGLEISMFNKILSTSFEESQAWMRCVSWSCLCHCRSANSPGNPALDGHKMAVCTHIWAEWGLVILHLLFSGFPGYFVHPHPDRSFSPVCLLQDPSLLWRLRGGEQARYLVVSEVGGAATSVRQERCPPRVHSQGRCTCPLKFGALVVSLVSSPPAPALRLK